MSPRLIFIDGDPDERVLERVLGEYRTRAPTVLGRDRMVARVARRLGLHSSLRDCGSTSFLNMHPQLVIAFRNADCIAAARTRGIPIRDER